MKSNAKSKTDELKCNEVGLRHPIGACPASYRIAGNFAIGLNRLRVISRSNRSMNHDTRIPSIFQQLNILAVSYV